MHYDLSLPVEYQAAAERALHAHPAGCPANESVKGAIAVTWDATLHIGDQVVTLQSADHADT